jgi:arylsulfatase A-like enzyme
MSISRRTFAGGVAVALMTAGLTRFHKGNKPEGPPNLVLFVADDMRHDSTGFAGNTIVQTTALDRLAASGIVFANHFVTTSVCPTSRASMIGGQYALHHGVYGFSAMMTDRALDRSFPAILKRNGYHTGFVGKWGMGSPRHYPFFDYWNGFSGQGQYAYGADPTHLTDLQTAQAMEFLKTRPTDTPFMLMVSYKAPHVPWIPQERFKTLYENVSIPRARTDTAEAEKRLPPLLRASLARQAYEEQFFSEEEYQAQMRDYYRLVTGIDDSIATVLSELEKQGKADTTSIMFTSDNGLMTGEHGLLGKWCMYEDSIRVPLVMRPAPAYYPKLSAMKTDAMTLNVDIAPTALALCGHSTLPPAMQGKNLMGSAGVREGGWSRQGFYYEHPMLADSTRQPVIACEGYRNAQWKYARYHHNGQSQECLFHLAQDPLELLDLAADNTHAATLDTMRRALEETKARLKEGMDA